MTHFVSNDGIATLAAEQDEFDDTASTLYATSTLYDGEDIDDTLTLVSGDKSAQLSEDDLQHMCIVVVGLAINKTSPNSKIIYYCVLSIQNLSNDRFVERFRIIKRYSQLVDFDSLLKYQGYKGEPLIKKNVFCSHSPQLVDQQKILLEVYFRDILNSYQQFKDISAIINFFNTDKEHQEHKVHRGIVKEGYLTKKEGSKLFGKWIAQYFILKEGKLNYYDQKGGIYLGSIELKDMSIGCQSADYQGTDYRHGLVIKQLMKRHDGHMLCAYSDEDRDMWVTALTDAARLLDIKPQHHHPNLLLGKLMKKK